MINQRVNRIEYLNLGCGYRYNQQWTNVNFTATGKEVIAYDLLKKIPFADNTFEVVYHSHLLEHIPKDRAQSFITECYRVLQPGGIIRVVVPDLEQIARVYLESIKQADKSEQGAANHEWMTLELLDQLVRDRRGGDMAAYLAKEKIHNREFVTQRFGQEAKRVWQTKQQPSSNMLKQFKKAIANYELLPKSLNRLFKAIQIGYYRQNGEVHQWMYDRYSLSVLLKNCGFENIVRRTASESYIPNWDSFNLDTEPDGSIYKPDSLFVEAIKPDY